MNCTKCGEPISDNDIDFKHKLCLRRRLPYDGPPKVCFKCVMGIVFSWDENGNDPADAVEVKS